MNPCYSVSTSSRGRKETGGSLAEGRAFLPPIKLFEPFLDFELLRLCSVSTAAAAEKRREVPKDRLPEDGLSASPGSLPPLAKPLLLADEARIE